MTTEHTAQVVKIPGFALHTETPLKTNLNILAATYWDWLPKSNVSAFAKNHLGVPRGQFAQWYRLAGWGFLASRLLETYAMQNRLAELMTLVEPIDYSPIQHAKEGGKGVMLVAAHTSATFPAYVQIAADNPDIMPLSRSSHWNRNETSLGLKPLSTSSEKGAADTSQTIKTHLLQENGIVYNNCDGRFGSRSMAADFLGQKITLYTGFAATAKKLGTPTLWASMTWIGSDKIKVSFEKIEIDNSLDDESWIRKWYETYLEKLASQIKSSPRDIGFQYGLWSTERGGLKWRSQ